MRYPATETARSRFMPDSPGALKRHSKRRLYMHSRRIGLACVAIVGIILCLSLSITAYTQITGATITGTTSDPSGAAIPRAQISTSNVATVEVRAVGTDAAGLYAAPN